MGRKDNKKRDEPTDPAKWSNEIIGMVWLGCGLVLIVLLVS